MMRRLTLAMGLCLSGAVLWAPAALAQRRPVGSWWQAGGNAQRTGDQPIEDRITQANAKNIHQLWKLKLPGAMGTLPSEPLVVGRLITEHGFRDEALVLTSTFEGYNLYGVDYELGNLMWSKYIDFQGSPAQNCPAEGFASFTVQPQAAFRFGRRGARGARGARRGPPPPPPVTGPERQQFGVSSGGGFRMRGVFVISPDGLVREFRTTNGADFGAPVKVIPFRDNAMSAASIAGDSLYVTSTADCGGVTQADGTWTPAPNAVWAVNGASAAYPATSWKAGANLSGLAQSTDGKTLYVVTGAGSGAHANSVVALNASGLTVKDYYTASGSAQADIDVAPAVFAVSGHDYVAAYSADGRLVLLNSASLGGTNHTTPAAETAPLTMGGGRAWGRLATASINGTRFVFASVHGAPNPALHLAANGAAANGAVVAFKVTAGAGGVTLTPAWASPNMVDPSPAVIASGMVFALANGSSSSPARLMVLNAATGAPVYTSGSQLPTDAHEASISLAQGMVLFLTTDNTLYSYGIPIQH